MIREMFAYAKEHEPCIIFMDEIDAIGGRRFSEGTSADREIQRTLMEVGLSFPPALYVPLSPLSLDAHKCDPLMSPPASHIHISLFHLFIPPLLGPIQT